MMVNVKSRVRVGAGRAPSTSRRQPPIESGYQHFRMERQGALLADKTLLYYDDMLQPFLRWLDGEGVPRFDDLNAGLVRAYRAQLAARPSQYGRPLQPKTILESHRAILCFPRPSSQQPSSATRRDSAWNSQGPSELGSQNGSRRPELLGAKPDTKVIRFVRANRRTTWGS